jgi:hypothetical protein
MTNSALEQLFLEYKQTAVTGRYITSEKVYNCLSSLGYLKDKVTLGLSVLQKPILGFEVGKGPLKLLIWSQMHGNEATTTKALVDLMAFLKSNTVVSDSFLKECTLFIIPILNPDGAEVYSRENANSIDLNRDFYDLSQPESQILMQVFNDFKPNYCFNLHDQRTIYGVGNPPQSATVSFLAPAFNAERSINLTRLEAMRLIVLMKNALKLFIPNQIGRYDDSFNRNCAGDTFQYLNVPTILFEAGHFPDDYEREKTRFYIFIALFHGIKAVSENVIVNNIMEDYMQIPQNNSCFFDIVYRNVKIVYENSEFITSFALQYSEEVLANQWVQTARIVSIGDLRNFKGHIEIDAKELSFNTIDNILPFINQKADFMLGNSIKVVNGLIKI